MEAIATAHQYPHQTGNWRAFLLEGTVAKFFVFEKTGFHHDQREGE